jgi:NDP-sugar pyrophosphorylase family protein
MSEAVIKHLSSRAKKGIHIEYSFDGPEQLGTGGAIQKALPFLGDAFGVIYGDSYLPTNFIPIEQEFLNSKVIGLMTIFQNDNQFESSNVEFVDGKLINYEKGTNSRNMSHIDYGLTFFKGSAFSPWKDRPSFDLSEVCHQLAKKEQLVGFEVFERFYEIGSVGGINEFLQFTREATNEF